MRLSTVLVIAAFVALAACDSKGPPRIGATTQSDQGAVTMPVTTTPAVQAAAKPVAAKACPDPAEIIAKACPPDKIGKPPAKPVKVRRHPRGPRQHVVSAPAPAREYARVQPREEVREYARIEAPPPTQGRIVQEEVYESYRGYPPPPPVAYAPPPPRYYAPPPMAHAPGPPVYHQQPAVYAPADPCCTYPAAGRDANGFLTWPGKR